MAHTTWRRVEVLVLCTRMAAVIAIDSEKKYLQVKKIRETFEEKKEVWVVIVVCVNTAHACCIL